MFCPATPTVIDCACGTGTAVQSWSEQGHMTTAWLRDHNNKADSFVISRELNQQF